MRLDVIRPPVTPSLHRSSDSIAFFLADMNPLLLPLLEIHLVTQNGYLQSVTFFIFCICMFDL